MVAQRQIESRTSKYSRSGLSKKHEQYLIDRAISPRVAIQRGYATIADPRDLADLGFDTKQQNLVPCLAFPLLNGSVICRVIRPDNPRILDGKPAKYEVPTGHKTGLDIPDSVRGKLQDVSTPLYITESPVKADAGASKGLCIVGTWGVWGWKPEHFDSIVLDKRVVYIVFDSDCATNPHVRQAVEQLKSFLYSHGAIAHVLYLPPGAKVGLDDYFAQHTVEELLALPRTALPVIVVTNRPLPDKTADALAAVTKANDPEPVIYTRSDELVRITRRVDIVNGQKQIRTVIQDLTEPRLKNQLARTASWYSLDKKNVRHHISPPSEVVRDVLAMPDWNVPALEAIVEVPIVRPDGSVFSNPGYDLSTRLLYAPRGLTVPDIPDNPTQEDVRQAVQLFDEMLCDFPFTPNSKANAIALILTPFVRPAIHGLVPLALIDAPKGGTGKGLLASIVSLLATGRELALMSMTDDEHEIEKRITTRLNDGDTMIQIDNIPTGMPLNSSQLATALTAEFWWGRILGGSVSVNIPQRATWLGTGNNIALGGDIPRRVYWIRMDAKMARPEDRTDFRHPELKLWVMENRGQLVAAALTIIRAWYASGCKEASVRPLGSFAPWASTIGGILKNAGVQGFLENTAELRSQNDEEANQWEAFFIRWRTDLGGEWIKTRNLAAALQDTLALKEVLPEPLAIVLAKDTFNTILGQTLGGKKDMIYGRRRLEHRIDGHSKLAEWRVRRVGK